MPTAMMTSLFPPPLSDATYAARIRRSRSITSEASLI
jgi:hypothetical protein